MANNKLLVAIAAMGAMGLSLTTLAQPSCTTGCPGVYVGGQLGWANTDYELHDTGVPGFHEPSQDGIAGRVYLGYQFNQYLGLETGFAAFSDIDLPFDLGEIKTTQWDLLVRAGMPFGDSGFRGDIKAGAAYVFAKYDASSSSPIGDAHSDEVKPVAGASVSYSFCNNVSLDVSYLHTFGHSSDWQNDDHNAPTIDLVTFGVSYLFPIS